MTKIYLASASAQRKKLLQLTGLKFTVRPSRVPEIHQVTTSCAKLVQHNAFLKARDIAGKIRKGIVIGADTVVYDEQGLLILKPRDLAEAKAMLKRLFSRPHWVYTGVAIIDAEKEREQVDYERTKIYMDPLTDREIERYHRHTSPLDKAGGFDIEGRGGLFIRRVEGCYSNVIGLPLPKLRKMLKNFGVSLLGMFLLLNVWGCATEYNLATGQEETLLYGTDKEIQIGDAVAKQVEENFEVNTDFDVNQRVQAILNRIVAACDRQELVYSIKVLNEDEVNAVSLPGGYIYVFKGLLDRVKNDDQLAGVIAHEVGHVTAKHAMKRLQASYGYTLLQLLAVGSGNGEAAQGVNAIFTTAFLAYSRQDEFEADKLGVKYTQKAGYDPNEMVNVLEILKKAGEKEMQAVNYFRTHPYIPERMAVVRKEISGELGFRDYLNLTGTEAGASNP